MKNQTQVQNEPTRNEEGDQAFPEIENNSAARLRRNKSVVICDLGGMFLEIDDASYATLLPHIGCVVHTNRQFLYDGLEPKLRDSRVNMTGLFELLAACKAVAEREERGRIRRFSNWDLEPDALPSVAETLVRLCWDFAENWLSGMIPWGNTSAVN